LRGKTEEHLSRLYLGQLGPGQRWKKEFDKLWRPASGLAGRMAMR
jgi:hypothetical protein